MITLASWTRVWLAVGRTDMRKGFDGLSALVRQKLAQDPFCGHLFVFHGRRGDLLKVLWYDGQGLCLFAKRLEKGRFVWPSPADGMVVISPAQLGMLLEGIASGSVNSRCYANPSSRRPSAICGRAGRH
jgi:transposase